MTVLMYKNRFEPPILVGTKRHTIRGERKRRILVGTPLSHRVWVGKAYRSKQREIASGICVGVRPITVGETFVRIGNGPEIFKPINLDDFAVSDGFLNWSDMMEYYRDEKIKKPFDGVIIYWE